jgi:hypothetical protein
MAGNMGYCRFENTFHDLEDCADHVNDNLSKSEAAYRKKMIDLMHEMIDGAADEPAVDEEE